MNNVNGLVKEGLDGITIRDRRADKAISLEGCIQATLFSEIRNDMNTYAASRVISSSRSNVCSKIFNH